MTTEDNWLERVWTYREESVYPSLFGSVSRGIFPLTADILTEMFKQSDYDPRWLHHGVIEFAPSLSRQSWAYVTSGLSNAWEDAAPDPLGESGFGYEFLFETTQSGDWAILRLLHLMTFQLLLAHGRYPGKEPLGLYDRLPLRGPITPAPSSITYLMMAPSSYEEIKLESGSFVFVQAVGVTEEEITFARAHGGDKLQEKLSAAGAFPVTDPARRSVPLDGQ